MEELQVIETTSGRQFKPWATKDDVQDPASVTAIASEIASGKQAIAAAINAKGGEASATESFAELAQDIQDTPTSGVLSSGIVQSEPFKFLDYVCRQVAYPITEIDDSSVTVIDRPNAFYRQTQLLKVTMNALTTISGNYVFQSCTALQEIDMPNLTTISGGNVFESCQSLQEIELPNLVTISGSGRVFSGTDNLQYAIFPKLSQVSGYDIFYYGRRLVSIEFGTLTQLSQPFYASTVVNLRNITIGQDTDINLPFKNWTATNVIAEGQSGIDELNANLQTNLISKLYQGGGKILRLGAELYDVTTQETRDMVTAKGWTLQRG